MQNTKLRFTLICLILILTIGCAPKFKEIKLGYMLENVTYTTIPNAEKYSIFVDLFNDTREVENSTIVGEAKREKSKDLYPLVIEQSLDSLSTLFFQNSFENLGFKISNSQESSDFIFRGRINKFWLKEITEKRKREYCESIIEYDVALFLKNMNDPIWFDLKRTIHKSRKVSKDITLHDEKILNETLNKSMYSILNDNELNRVLNDICNASNIE